MTKRNSILIIIAIIIIAIIIYWYNKPKITLTPDWVNKKVKYKFSAGSCRLEGTKLFEESTPIEKTCNNGYQFKIWGQDIQRGHAFEAVIWKGESDKPIVPVQYGDLVTQKIILKNTY